MEQSCDVIWYMIGQTTASILFGGGIFLWITYCKWQDKRCWHNKPKIRSIVMKFIRRFFPVVAVLLEPVLLVVVFYVDINYKLAILLYTAFIAMPSSWVIAYTRMPYSVSRNYRNMWYAIIQKKTHK